MAWTKRRIAWAAAAYLLLFGMHRVTGLAYDVLRALSHLVPSLSLVCWTLYQSVETLMTGVYPLLVLVGTLFGGAVAVLRIYRRAHAGSASDPLIQLRDALRAHPRLASVLPWLPFAYWLRDAARWIFDEGMLDRWEYAELFSLPITAVATTVIGKLLLHALDHVENREAPVPPQVAAEETVFRAVAVTTRSQAIVVSALALATSMIAFISTVKLSTLGLGPLSTLVLGYAAILGVTARWYQVASTIRVGSDGVFVQGTSKTRFHAYRDFDAVRVSGATLHLLRGTSTVVRLQLHGADLHRGAFLAERIESALTAARIITGAESLLGHGRSAHGGVSADYRNAALSREQLWELIEADGTAGSARTAAAEMLAPSLDRADRTRLRVAASHTVDPRVRIALETVAGDVQPERQTQNGGEIDEETAAPAAAGRLLIP